MKESLRNYIIVTASYWAFTLTDSALRMLVLLHLHTLGFKPIQIASLFVFYEVFGVLTNFFGGWIGAKFGLKSTLISGQGMQIVACTLLAMNGSNLGLTVIMVAQALSGIGKDLTKMSAKSFIKLMVPPGNQSGLMKWVAILTGSKNALKGVGFFLGGLLLTTFGFRHACLLMAGLLGLSLVVGQILLPRASGKSQSKVKLKHIFSKDPRLNWLAAARLFLFGSRDVWFALSLPLFLSTALHWSFTEVGAFMACWVMGYGLVQAVTPLFVGRAESGAPDSLHLCRWTTALLIPLFAIILAPSLGASLKTTVILGLGVFAVVFAANSAIHSYLVVAYAENDKVALRVGFYYMANAMGRLIGTFLSGALYQISATSADGLDLCLMTSIGFVATSAVICCFLRRAEQQENPLAAN